MKKVLLMLLALVLVLSFTACGKPDEPVKDNDQNVNDNTDNDQNVNDDQNADADGEDDKVEEKVMTYAEYMAANKDAAVVIEAYVQAKQGWWTDDTGVSKATIYAQDKDGGYFIYDLPCSEEEYNKMTVGTKIRVSGFKAEFNGEVEIGAGAKLTIIEDAEKFTAEAKDVTALLGTEELINDMNKFVAFKGLTVAAKKDSAGNDVAFFYNWDGSGSQGSDLYFDVTDGTNTYSFTVESYLCGKDTDVYKAVEALKVGDKIDAEGFLYWYNGANPHITSVTVIAE